MSNSSVQFNEGVTEEERWLQAIINDDGNTAHNILNSTYTPTSTLSLRVIYKKQHFLKHIQSQCVLSASTYIPDNAWCLAAVFDSRQVLQVMHNFGVDITQSNSHGNTFLHCIIANASLLPEDGESQCIKTIIFIKSIMTDENFKRILLTENKDRLRPLELAAHLGTFIIFRNLFETNSLYMAKTQDLGFYSLQHYDITEYVDGSRFFNSPLILMLYLEQRKLEHRSTRYMYLSDPMKSWIAAVTYCNTPFIIILAVLQSSFIATYFYVLVAAKSYDGSLEPTKMVNATSGNIYNNQTQHENNTMLFVFLCFDIFFTAASILWHVMSILLTFAFGRKLKRLIEGVSGRKHLVVYKVPYLVSDIVTLIGVLIMSLDVLHSQLFQGQIKTKSSLSVDINYMVLIAVFTCAWNLLYYLQHIPGLNVYVIAVQRMLIDLLSFFIIFAMFILSFSFGFYMLTGTSKTLLPLLYDSFRLSLNMMDFSQASGALQFLHVAFVFVIVYLLQNIIIAIFSSSFQHVYQNKDIIFCVQSLSISLIFEQQWSRIMRPLYNRLRRKYFIYEDGRIYVTKVVMKPVHTKLYDNQRQQ